jgi:hypothetical protein
MDIIIMAAATVIIVITMPVLAGTSLVARTIMLW